MTGWSTRGRADRGSVSRAIKWISQWTSVVRSVGRHGGASGASTHPPGGAPSSWTPLFVVSGRQRRMKEGHENFTQRSNTVKILISTHKVLFTISCWVIPVCLSLRIEWIRWTYLCEEQNQPHRSLILHHVVLKATMLTYILKVARHSLDKRTALQESMRNIQMWLIYHSHLTIT